jgi:hypothetical protein
MAKDFLARTARRYDADLPMCKTRLVAYGKILESSQTMWFSAAFGADPFIAILRTESMDYERPGALPWSARSPGSARGTRPALFLAYKVVLE